jgi:hypothetical protein
MLICNLTLSMNFFAQTVSQPYQWTNNENPPGTAKDFHVKFSPPPIPPIIYSPGAAFTNGVNGGNGLDFFGNGTGIAPGGTFGVTATFAGKNPGRVTEYWWTKDGSSANMNNLTNIVGKKHGKQAKGKFSFVMATPSTGNGTISITVLSDLYVFHFPPGLFGDQVAIMFALYIKSIPNGVVESDEGNIPVVPNEVTVFFTTFNGTEPNFTVSINQDSTQHTDFVYVDTADIPTLSQWGLIILALLFVASGLLYIRKRQSVLAIAGGSETVEAQQGLFLTRKFYVISAILLGLTLLLFGANAIVTGSVVWKDLAGTLVSSVILAYIIHLIEMFRSKEIPG